MYEHFFGLVEKPFSVTPNTRYLYPSSQHDGAIKTLLYGIEQRKGFMVLIGEVGTGKTTSIRALLNLLGESVQTSLILNPLLSTFELLKCLCTDFGCGESGNTLNEQLEILNRFLIENDKKGGNAVVIIDEAQNLSFEALEMTRLLSNLETESYKLLQIVLVGQPEFEEKLTHKSMRQLAQRVQVFMKLKPLNHDEMEHYINHRIHLAGNNPAIAFEKSAIKELYKVSRGIPRIVNTVCDLSLLAAFARETHVITRHLIQEAVRETPIHVHHS